VTWRARMSAWLSALSPSPWRPAVTIPHRAAAPFALKALSEAPGRFLVRQRLSGRTLLGYQGDSGATAQRIFREYAAFRPGEIECVQIDPDGTQHRRGYRGPRRHA
jgi:hypothetical protein